MTGCTHTKAFAHTKVLGLFWQAASLLFCFMGQGGGGGVGWRGGRVVLQRCLWYSGSVCALVRKEAPVRSIHPLRRFPAECDVRVGKWAGPRILCLLWIWHELGPRPLWMWWMYYLIFLSLLTSLWLKAQWFWGDETTSPVWPLDFDEV